MMMTAGTKRRFRRQRMDRIRKTMLEVLIFAALGAVFSAIFWEGLHRQWDLQDAQNRAWAAEAQR